MVFDVAGFCRQQVEGVGVGGVGAHGFAEGAQGNLSSFEFGGALAGHVYGDAVVVERPRENVGRVLKKDDAEVGVGSEGLAVGGVPGLGANDLAGVDDAAVLHGDEGWC